MKRQVKESKRVKDGIEIILDLLDNKQFLEGFGHYIKVGEHFILPKFQEALYEKRYAFDAKELIADEHDYMAAKIKNFTPPEGNCIYFLVPLSAVIALPPFYRAFRSTADKDNKIDTLFSITLINAMHNHGIDEEDDDILHGFAFALLGFYTNERIDEVQYLDIYESCVGYLNDFITAYKLFRHDHTVENVTSRTLPSVVDCYYLPSRTGSLEEFTIAIHANDLADMWSKRLPESPRELNKIMELCEFLPDDKLAHYTLRIGERSLTGLCLGQYEDCIIDSDRFTELVLRDILRQELRLSDDGLSEYKTLYSTDKRTKAVVQTLANHLGCKGDAIISLWYEKARKIRNDIIHKLEIESVDADMALEALRYNMKIVELMADKSQLEFEWYKLIPKEFSALFES